MTCPVRILVYGGQSVLRATSALTVVVFVSRFAGDPDYCEVRNEFYDNTKALLLVFDVTRKSSFEKLSAWLAEAAKFGLTSESAIVIIVANKTEQNPREVTEQEVSRRCILIAQSRLDPGEPSI